MSTVHIKNNHNAIRAEVAEEREPLLVRSVEKVGIMRTKRKILQIFLDLLILLIVFLPWIVLHSIGKPFVRGFFCDDESIKYPYHESTVTNAVMSIVGLVLSFVTIIVVESIHQIMAKRAGTSPSPIMFGRLPVPAFIVNIYSASVLFLFGAAVQQTIVNIAKYAIGRLRPHFLSVCKPDYTKINCTLTNGVLLYKYMDVGDEVCSPNADLDKLEDARLSFPSGHSSFSLYVAVFLSLYLHVMLMWSGCRLVKHCIQAVLLYAAVFVCVSRVSDYKHHWSDVFAGAFVGAITAVLTVLFISDWYRADPRRNELSHNGNILPPD